MTLEMRERERNKHSLLVLPPGKHLMFTVEPDKVEYRFFDHAMHSRCVASIYSDLMHSVVLPDRVGSRKTLRRSHFASMRRAKAGISKCRDIHRSQFLDDTDEALEISPVPARKAFRLCPVMGETHRYPFMIF